MRKKVGIVEMAKWSRNFEVNITVFFFSHAQWNYKNISTVR